ncbi:hypothetical protein ACFVAV_17775 [Nocardia sp. NPDC057663]|uniref:hypothetical protein n=1 Tax=Nocardia sp. NPDC057663 TaxID=3346201 RepID=UPI00366F7273
MPLVVVAGATITCSHLGTKFLTRSDTTHTIAGKAIMTAGSEIGVKFTSPNDPPGDGLEIPCSAQSGGVFVPCTIAAPTTGVSVKAKVGALPVLLATSTGVTASATGPGTWKVTDPGQTVADWI